jgi:hypothetical protein
MTLTAIGRINREVTAQRAAGVAPMDVKTEGDVRGQSRRTPVEPRPRIQAFKKLAALAGVPVICLHEGGRHTGNSLMQDAGVDQELRMRAVGHATSRSTTATRTR